MSASVVNPTRTCTITLSEETARKVDQLCLERKLDIAELVEHALRSFELERLRQVIQASTPRSVLVEMEKQEDEQMAEVVAYIKATRRRDEQEPKTA